MRRVLGARDKQVCARLARCGLAWRRSRGALGVTNYTQMGKRFIHWLLVEPLAFWIAVLIPLAGLYFCTRLVVSEPSIRLTGLALQLFGILAAVWGIAETWQQFELGDPINHMRNWLRRCPLRKARVVTAAMNATSSADVLSAHGYAWWKPDPSAPLEKRIEILEKNVPLLNERIDRTQDSIQTTAKELIGRMDNHASVSGRRAADLDRKLTEFSTGSLHISAIGAFWVFVGSILGSASPEILKFVQ